MKCVFEVTNISNQKVYLRDFDGRMSITNDARMSITNDAESVLEWCKENYPNHRLFYTDTYGELIEIVDKPHTTWMGTSPITFRTGIKE